MRHGEKLELLAHFDNVSHVRTGPIAYKMFSENLTNPPVMRKIHYPSVEVELVLVKDHSERL